MTYLVVSDIHGALSGANAILDAMKYHNVLKIICLGDILYHGPRNDLPEDYKPKEVIKIMNSLKDNIICVRGNCEAEVDQMVLEFPVTSDYNVIYLNDRKVFITHGHIYGPNNLPTLLNGDALLSGHTHIATADCVEGIYLLNPGSISLPKNNTPRSYALLDDKGFTIYDLNHTKIKSVEF